MRVLVYFGPVLPPPKPAPKNLKDVHENDFIEENHNAMQLEGLPHMFHHFNTWHSLGRVLHSYNEPDGKYVCGFIRANDPFTGQIADAIENGEGFASLSLTHGYAAKNVDKNLAIHLAPKLGVDVNKLEQIKRDEGDQFDNFLFERKRVSELSTVCGLPRRPGCYIKASKFADLDEKRYI